MPDNDPVNNAPHLAHRLGVDAAAHPSPIGVDENSAAIAIEAHIRDGDHGAVRRFVHEMEYQLGVWHVSPWRLLEHLAGRAIGRQQETPGDSAPGAEVALRQPGTVEHPAAAGAPQPATRAVAAAAAVPELTQGPASATTS